ncbi:MAG: alkaline phosphatase family protein [Sphingobacteriales bacterium]|nr:MAG: alkaline phosphatase family protein [Sphingobacteriales bacterium]TAF78217.1 MAG: alkaline phosphatase family protein [Sphingobacteriales bacterium]
MLQLIKKNIYTVLIVRLLIVFAIYTICRVLFYTFNYQMFSGISSQNFILILVGGLKFDVSAILYLNSLFILSQAVPFNFRFKPLYQKVCAQLYFITNGIGIAVNIADIAYYPFTLRRTSFSLFTQFLNEKNLGQLAIKFMFIDFWYLTIICITCLFLMFWLYKKSTIVPPSIKNKKLYYTLSSVVMLLLAWFTVAGMRGGFRHSTRPITLSNAGEYVSNPAEINLVLNTPFAIMQTINTQPLQKVNYFSDSLRADSLYSPIHLPPHKKAPFLKKNLVIIILESFSREYLGGFNKTLEDGKYKGYTPFLDSLKKVSLSFNNAYANGRSSIEALPSVLTSIPNINEPYILSYYSGNKLNGLPSLLAKKGYHTSFFHGAPNGSMGFSSFVKMAGVQHYYGKTEYNNDADFDDIWGIWDEPFFNYWANTMATFKQPFISTLFSVSSHHPFEVPAAYKNKFAKGTLPVHQTIGYTDMALRKFFASAATKPWYKNTLFIITADHSSVAYHPQYQTSMGAFAIPILFFDPSGELKGEVNYPVQQIDIMPTVLNYLNYDLPYFAFGKDMLNPLPNNFVVNTSDNSYQLSQGNYVLMYSNHKTQALYNYKEDILLQHNIASQNPIISQLMENYIKAFIQQYNKHTVDNTFGVK